MKFFDFFNLTFLRKNKGVTVQNKTFESISNNEHVLTEPELVMSDMKLATALQKGQFSILYQPQVNSVGKIHGAEALLRWKDPEKGVIPPDVFIKKAENSGDIFLLTKWVIANVCEQLNIWRKNDVATRPVSINISPVVLMNHQLVDYVKEQLEIYKIQANQLVFEITESQLLVSGDSVRKSLDGLRKLGIPIAIDDFGTGYATFDYVRQFHPDSLKIDQVFIKNLDPTNIEDKTIIASILFLAKGLDMEVIAEGVETYEQFEYLKQQECDFMQGYYFSEPLPAVEFENLLKRGVINPEQRRTVFAKKERRRFFRFDFTHFVHGQMTVSEVNNKKMDTGSADILIKDIGLGGLKFMSTLSFPIVSNIRFRFTFTLCGEDFDLAGKLRWKNLENANTFIYGVEFELNKPDEQRLSATINKMAALKKRRKEIPDTPFIYEDPSLFFK